MHFPGSCYFCYVRFKTTRLEFLYIKKTNFFCGEPFRLLVIPATLGSKTTLVGATQMTLIGAAIDNIFRSEGQVSTIN